jgi:hypothetical protein
MSQTNTLAPVAANARANSRPMPAAPAVIKTRCGIAPLPRCIHRRARPGVAAIPKIMARHRQLDRDDRDKPGHDEA